jgi:hypothetical protein
VVKLAPFNEAVLQHFIYLERQIRIRLHAAGGARAGDAAGKI